MTTTSFPLTLPSSELPIKFRMPKGKDQCFSLANQDREKGLPAEFVLAVRCIESINHSFHENVFYFTSDRVKKESLAFQFIE